MKTMLYALAAVALTASAAAAEPTSGRSGPVSEAASVKAPETGPRYPYVGSRMPVSLERSLEFEAAPLDAGRVDDRRGWTGNDNEG